MIGFYRFLLGLEHTLAIASREVGRPVDERELDGWIADEATLGALFLGEIAECATPCVVHSAVTAEMFQSRYCVEANHIPFSLYRPWSPSQLTPTCRLAARERLGFKSDEIVIATFGFVQDTKAPEDCVWALDLLRRWGFNARLDFVGALYWLADKGVGLRALIASLSLQDVVTFAEGFVPEQTYRDYLVGSDLAVQLRTYGFGSLSGALSDCAAAGLRSVSNRSLGEAVGAPSSYVRSIPDSISAVLLAEALANLLESGPSTTELEADRAAFSDERSFRHYSARLCNVLGL
jgi:glycosyltransferase involved in cell wall biosynthesis